jgi:hypothetical protein
MAQNTEAQIACPHRPGRNLLARFTGNGLALWCKRCMAEHVLTWTEMARIEAALKAEK